MKYYTITQVSELLAISRNSVYRLISQGQLESDTIGNGTTKPHRRITETQLNKYLQQYRPELLKPGDLLDQAIMEVLSEGFTRDQLATVFKLPKFRKLLKNVS